MSESLSAESNESIVKFVGRRRNSMEYLSCDVNKRDNLTWFYPRICSYQDELKDQNDYFSFLNKERESQGDLLLYVHIPFCKSFCAYCACFKEHLHSFSHEEKTEFAHMLVNEMSKYSQSNYFKMQKVSHIQFGGGTPSCLDNELLKIIFDGIHKNFLLSDDCDISFEGNVMTLKSLEKLSFLKSEGVNRLSFGIQTFNENIRKKIGIQAKIEEVYEAAENIKKVKFESFAIDLIYNLPDQDLELLEIDLNKSIKEISPTYIQTYRFNQFHNTALYKNINNGRFANPPSPEKELMMFEYILGKMYSNGYDNHVLINLFCNTNDAVSTGLELTMGNNSKKSSIVLGIGPGASSFLDGYNFKTVCSIEKYISMLKEGMLPVEAGVKSSKAVVDSRRMVFFPNFMKIRKKDIPDTELYRDRLDYLVANEFIDEEVNCYKLTLKGKLWAGEISNIFYAPEEVEKIKKSFYYSLKNKKNPFNQDEMNIH